MPKIGKRILKSSFAVFLCFLIYILRNEQGIVFYSCIAAVLCVQQSTSNTIRVARNRVEGTLIGGFMGMLVLLFEKSFIPHDLILIQYLLISFMIIPIIYITVVLKKTSASYISCVVFMSITVSHAADVNPYMFAIDRIIDTLIGIFVALVINAFHLSRRMEKDALYYVDYDALCKEGSISSYASIRLRHALERGAHVGMLSDETPGVFMPHLAGLPFTHPVICMRGAMLYDIAAQCYRQVHTLSDTIYHTLFEQLKQQHLDVFVYTVIYDMMHVYYGTLEDEKAKQFYQDVRRQPYENYVYGTLPEKHAALCLMVLDDTQRIYRLKEELTQYPYANQIHVYTRTYQKQQSWSQLFITAAVDEAHPVCTMLQESSLPKLRVISSHEDSALTAVASSYDIATEKHVIHTLEAYYYHPKASCSRKTI